MTLMLSLLLGLAPAASPAAPVDAPAASVDALAWASAADPADPADPADAGRSSNDGHADAPEAGQRDADRSAPPVPPAEASPAAHTDPPAGGHAAHTDPPAGGHADDPDHPPANGADRLPSYVANQEERHGLGVHPHEDDERLLGDGLEGHAWARVGYHLLKGGEELRHGPYLGMARLQMRISDGERLSAFVHLGADSGDLTLLDAKMRARISDRFLLALGRMKVPVSHDFLVPASQMLLPTRALLDGLSPQRAIGALARYRAEGDHSTTTVRVGVFDPMNQLDEALAGPQIVGQVGVHTHGGFFVHAAGAAWLPGKDLHVDALAAGPVWDRQLDGALGWSNEAWTLEAEGLVARPVSRTGPWDYGATVLAARRVPIAGERFVLEPVLAGDIRAREDRMLRGTVAVNLHEDGWHLLETLAWEVTDFGHGHPEHRVLLQVQAGL